MMNCLTLISGLARNVGLSKIKTEYILRHATSASKIGNANEETSCEKTDKIAKKLRAKTPIGKLDELDVGKHPYQEKEPLKEWPDNTNPHTGEVGGPRGPEPTRYGDWERKGRVTDF